MAVQELRCSTGKKKMRCLLVIKFFVSFRQLCKTSVSCLESSVSDLLNQSDQGSNEACTLLTQFSRLFCCIFGGRAV